MLCNNDKFYMVCEKDKKKQLFLIIIFFYTCTHSSFYETHVAQDNLEVIHVYVQ